MTDAWGGSRKQVKPPDKGVFPLDHFNECKKFKEEYMHCLRGNQAVANDCRKVSKMYLQCRMDR